MPSIGQVLAIACNACRCSMDKCVVLTSVLVVHNERRVSRHDGGAARQVGEHNGVHVHLQVPARHHIRNSTMTGKARTHGPRTEFAPCNQWIATSPSNAQPRGRSLISANRRARPMPLRWHAALKQESIKVAAYLGNRACYLRQRELVVPPPSVQLLSARWKMLQRVVGEPGAMGLGVPSRARRLRLLSSPHPRVMLTLPSGADRLAVTLASRGSDAAAVS